MFSNQSGWLSYAPFKHFQLPEVVQVYDFEVTAAHNDGKGMVVNEGREVPVKVPFCDRSGNVKFTRNLYRLVWPGQLRPSCDPKAKWVLHDEVPGQFLLNWGVRQVRVLGNDLEVYGHETHSLLDVIKTPNVLLPEVLPAAVAYHLAVNADTYFPNAHDPKHISYGLTTRMFPHPVGALWSDRLSQVLDARFALDAEAVAALRYLKWVAEGHRQHPLLTGFDTMIREHLLALCEVTVQLYFGLLQDYLYDGSAHYWVKDDWKAHWWQLAGYLFWIGRTGDARVTDHAGIDPIWQNSVKRFQEVCPDVVTGLEQWRALDYGRKLARVDGKDPCIVEPGDEEPVLGATR